MAYRAVGQCMTLPEAFRPPTRWRTTPRTELLLGFRVSQLQQTASARHLSLCVSRRPAYTRQRTCYAHPVGVMPDGGGKGLLSCNGAELDEALDPERLTANNVCVDTQLPALLTSLKLTLRAFCSCVAHTRSDPPLRRVWAAAAAQAACSGSLHSHSLARAPSSSLSTSLSSRRSTHPQAGHAGVDVRNGVHRLVPGVSPTLSLSLCLPHCVSLCLPHCVSLCVSLPHCVSPCVSQDERVNQVIAAPHWMAGDVTDAQVGASSPRSSDRNRLL